MYKWSAYQWRSDWAIGSLRSQVEHVYVQWEHSNSTIVARRSHLPHLCDPAKSNFARFLERLSDRDCAAANQRRGERVWILIMEDGKLIEAIPIRTRPTIFNIKLRDCRNTDLFQMGAEDTDYVVRGFFGILRQLLHNNLILWWGAGSENGGYITSRIS